MTLEIREAVHVFWHGTFTLYEYKCIESFVRNNFVVNVWSYDPLDIPPGAHARNAAEILPRDHLYKYKQRHFLDAGADATEYSSIAAFSDAFRVYCLNLHGGWWADADSFCLKDQREYKLLKENKHVVFGGHYTDSFDPLCGILCYSGDKVSSIFVEALVEKCERYDYTFPTWAEIGPALIREVVIEQHWAHEAAPSDVFYPILWSDIDLYINPARIDEARERVAGSHCTHLWNSQLSEVYKLKSTTPKNNFLAELFSL